MEDFFEQPDTGTVLAVVFGGGIVVVALTQLAYGVAKGRPILGVAISGMFAIVTLISAALIVFGLPGPVHDTTYVHLRNDVEVGRSAPMNPNVVCGGLCFVKRQAATFGLLRGISAASSEIRSAIDVLVVDGAVDCAGVRDSTLRAATLRATN